MQEQEVNLRDYINVIIKRKWIILTVFFVGIITAAIISSLLPKVYVATATVQIGNINGPVMNKLESEEIIRSHEILNPIIEKLELDVSVENLKKAIEIENIESTDFFRFVVRYKTGEMALKICQEIVDSYLNFGIPSYQKRVNIVDEHLKNISLQIENVEEDIQYLRSTISPFSLFEEELESVDSGEILPKRKVVFLQDALSNHEVHLSFLINQKSKLNLIKVRAKEFKIIDQPFCQKNPLMAKIGLNIAISGIVSFIFGIFLAFFVEYWEQSK